MSPWAVAVTLSLSKDQSPATRLRQAQADYFMIKVLALHRSSFYYCSLNPVERSLMKSQPGESKSSKINHTTVIWSLLKAVTLSLSMSLEVGTLYNSSPAAAIPSSLL